MPVPIDIQIQAVKREISKRGYVYPRLVIKGTMKQREATHEMECMVAVLETLQQVAARERLI